MWKAIVNSKADVDSAGNIEVNFDVYLDDKLFAQSMLINGNPNDIEKMVKEVLLNLKNNVDAAKNIKVKQVITL